MDRLNVEGTMVESIEVFFGGFPRFIPQIGQVFTNLSCLRIVGQELTTIDHLSCLGRSLDELWVVECHITTICGLSDLTALTKLYLSDNDITRIEGLSSLTKLKCLWLNTNRLTSIQVCDHHFFVINQFYTGRQLILYM